MTVIILEHVWIMCMFCRSMEKGANWVWLKKH